MRTKTFWTRLGSDGGETFNKTLDLMGKIQNIGFDGKNSTKHWI